MEDPIQIVLCGKQLTISPNGNKTLWESMATDRWELDSLELIAEQLNENDVFVDMGAWAGPISLFAAHFAAKVYAIEPDPIVFEQLLRNIKLNPSLINKVIPFEVAISDKNEHKKLFARKDYGQSSTSLLSRTFDQNSTHECESLTFSKYIQHKGIKKVNFIKMDIEGSEFFVLPEIIPTLERLNYPSLLVSFHMDYLVEYFLKKWGISPFLSRIIMKLHRRWKLYPFKKLLQNYSNRLEPLIGCYPYCYAPNGSSINFRELLNDPFQLGLTPCFFSKQQWIKHD